MTTSGIEATLRGPTPQVWYQNNEFTFLNTTGQWLRMRALALTSQFIQCSIEFPDTTISSSPPRKVDITAIDVKVIGARESSVCKQLQDLVDIHFMRGLRATGIDPSSR